MDVEQIKNIKLSFIVTTARTGSTLLSTMLNSHPNVLSTVEEPFAYSLFPGYAQIKNWTSETIQDYCNDFYLFSEGKLAVQFGTRTQFVSLLEKYKEHLDVQLAIRLTYLCFFPQKNKEAITTVVDKQLIMHECVGKVAEFYPESKFIILYRDPRDNAYTKWRLFEKRKAFREKNYYKIALDWNYVYNILQKAKNKYPGRFMEVRYEDLVTGPEAVLETISAFLNVPYDPVMMEYDKLINRELETPFYQNMDKAAKKFFLSIQGGLFIKPDKEKMGLWKKILTEEETNLIWTINRKTAEQAGYTVHENYKRSDPTLKDYKGLFIVAIDRIKSFIYYNAPFRIKHAIKKLVHGEEAFNPDRAPKKYLKAGLRPE